MHEQEEHWHKAIDIQKQLIDELSTDDSTLPGDLKSEREHLQILLELVEINREWILFLPGRLIRPGVLGKSTIVFVNRGRVAQKPCVDSPAHPSHRKRWHVHLTRGTPLACQRLRWLFMMERQLNESDEARWEALRLLKESGSG